MFDKFEVLMSWKVSWGLSFLLFGVSDGHIFFYFSNFCPLLNVLLFKNPLHFYLYLWFYFVQRIIYSIFEVFPKPYFLWCFKWIIESFIITKTDHRVSA